MLAFATGLRDAAGSDPREPVGRKRGHHAVRRVDRTLGPASRQAGVRDGGESHPGFSLPARRSLQRFIPHEALADDERPGMDGAIASPRGRARASELRNLPAGSLEDPGCRPRTAGKGRGLARQAWQNTELAVPESASCWPSGHACRMTM